MSTNIECSHSPRRMICRNLSSLTHRMRTVVVSLPPADFFPLNMECKYLKPVFATDLFSCRDPKSQQAFCRGKQADANFLLANKKYITLMHQTFLQHWHGTLETWTMQDCNFGDPLTFHPDILISLCLLTWQAKMVNKVNNIPALCLSNHIYQRFRPPGTVCSWMHSSTNTGAHHYKSMKHNIHTHWLERTSYTQND